MGTVAANLLKMLHVSSVVGSGDPNDSADV